MTPDELRDALDGIYAFDSSGCECGCGIHNEALRKRVQAELHKMDDLTITKLIRDMFLSEEALLWGHRLEDLVRFVQWLDERMGYSVT